MSRRAVCARLEARCFALLLQATGRRCVRRLEHRHSQSHRPLDRDFARSFSSFSALLSIVSWGIFLYKWWTFRRAAQQSRAVSRRVPPQQQVLRGPGGLPVARRQPARRPVPDRLRRADRAAAADRAGRTAHGPNPRAACRTSYLEEPDGGGPRAAARVGGRGEQAREPHLRFSRRPRAWRRSSGCSARCGES